MLSEQPDNLGEVLRRIQDPATPLQEAKKLFMEHVLPIVQKVKERSARRLACRPCLRQWVEENAESFVYELLVIRPRSLNKPTFDCSRHSTLRAWLATCLHNEAKSYCRKKAPLTMEPDKIETYKTEKPRKQHAVETDDPSASIQWAKSSLHAALRKLSQLDAFSPPQRSNGVDYFSVLLLIVWLRLAQLYYDALRNDRSGQELICELRELLQELLPLPDEWCFRRMTAWTPSVRQIQEKLLQHWQQTNERPKMRDIVLHLSHSSNQSSNNKCEDALRNQLAQWVGRARYRYGIHAEILTPTEKRWLDALLMCDDEAQRQTV